jgi:hypothetical protein
MRPEYPFFLPASAENNNIAQLIPMIPGGKNLHSIKELQLAGHINRINSRPYESVYSPDFRKFHSDTSLKNKSGDSSKAFSTANIRSGLGFCPPFQYKIICRDEPISTARSESDMPCFFVNS